MNKKLMRKYEILDASIEEMYLKGYNSTSVNDIAVVASIPKGSFYNYFKDKEHYAVDAVHYYQDIMSKDKVVLLTNKDLAPLDRIKTFFKAGVSNNIVGKFKFGCFVGNLAQEMGGVSDIISEATSSFYNQIVELIYENLKEAKVNKELTKDVDLKSLASFIISAWQGSLLRSKVTKNQKNLDEFLKMLNEVLLV